jgi:hypothetical protein
MALPLNRRLKLHGYLAGMVGASHSLDEALQTAKQQRHAKRLCLGMAKARRPLAR